MFQVLLISFCLALGFAASSAQARESAPIVTPHATVTLASDVDAVSPGKSFHLGLHFKLAKGWHIYWSNPGVAGQPPQLDLTLPKGAKASPIIWPTPVRALEGPAMTYSYFNEVLLPLKISVPDGVSAFSIKAEANWLVCANICVPESGKLNLTLPVGMPTPSAEASLFQAAEARVPRPSPDAATASPSAVLTLKGAGLSPQSVNDAWFFPAAWGEIDDMAPQKLTVSHGQLQLALKPGETFNPKDGLKGVLVLKDSAGRERFFSIAAPLQAAASAPQAVVPPKKLMNAPTPAGVSLQALQATTTVHPMLLVTLGFAFLGGLILNLMPCVFPILAMKAIGVARLCGHAHSTLKACAASYTLGILVAFAGLAGGLLVLRTAGVAAGWGFQFQSPVFVAAIAWLLFAVGLNLSGVFEVAGSFGRVGDSLTHLHGHAGSFFTGLLAVLVATPCTVPFMGAAVAVAATAAPLTTVLIFLVMGLGLAAPYVLLALLPGAAKMLPRPGRWMLVLREVLAFPMYAAAVWLVWVISQEAGTDGVLVVLSGAVLIGFAGWLLQTTRMSEGGSRAFGRIGAGLSALGVLALLANMGMAPPALSTIAAEDAGSYSPTRLAELRAEGRPVFVDMTAAWCVTCLVNERVALSSAAVRRAFAAHNVAYLKGDWTRADPAITRFLHEYNHDGVPLYVFYPPKGMPPVVLPQVLTASIVLNEIDRYGG